MNSKYISSVKLRYSIEYDNDYLQIKIICKIFKYVLLILITIRWNNGYQIGYYNLHLSYWSCSMPLMNETDSYHLLLPELVWMTALRNISHEFLNGVLSMKTFIDGTVSRQWNFYFILQYLRKLVLCWSRGRITCSEHFIREAFISNLIFVLMRYKMHIFIKSNSS